jgi:hypothetical protein
MKSSRPHGDAAASCCFRRYSARNGWAGRANSPIMHRLSDALGRAWARPAGEPNFRGRRAHHPDT